MPAHSCATLFYNLLNWTATQERVEIRELPLVGPAHSSQNGLPLEQQIAAGQDVVRGLARYYLALQLRYPHCLSLTPPR